jgi:PKD repeat protein
VYTQGACDYSNNVFNLIAVEYPLAAFVVVDTANLEVPIAFTNSSTNASNYVWNFGDGSAISNVTSPIHSYSSVGLYKVSLVVESATACADSVIKFVRVVDASTGLSESESNRSLLVKNLGRNQYQLQQSYENSSKQRVMVMNASGQVLQTQDLPSSDKLNLQLDLDTYPSGIYSVTLFSEDQKTSIRVVVSK